jgi:hypothetical protein
MQSDLGLGSPEEMWRKFFAATVGSREVRRYLMDTVFASPARPALPCEKDLTVRDQSGARPY